VHVGGGVVGVPRAVRVHVDLTALIDQLERMVDGRRHGDELSLLLADVVHPERDIAGGQEASVLEQPEANRFGPTTSSDVVIIGCSDPATVGVSSPAADGEA